MLRKFRKLLQLIRNKTFRRGLRFGVGASIEHLHILKREKISTLIDIGANRGQFSLLVLGLYPTVRGFAFEPLNSACSIYEKVFEGVTNFSLFKTAIGSKKMQTEINVAEKSDSSSLLPFADVEKIFPGQGTHCVLREQITIAPLSDFVDRADIARPCFCKIDVQGFELEVIRGCDALLDLIDAFYIECSTVEMYQGQPLFDEIIEEMASRGFRIKRIGHVTGSPEEPGVQVDVLFSR